MDHSASQGALMDPSQADIDSSSASRAVSRQRREFNEFSVHVARENDSNTLELLDYPVTVREPESFRRTRVITITTEDSLEAIRSKEQRDEPQDLAQ